MNQKFEAILTQVVEDQKEMKSQITKLTSTLTVQEWGKFPSQPQSNPKWATYGRNLTPKLKKHQGVNAITTESAKILEGLGLPNLLNNTTTTSNTHQQPISEV